MNNIFFCLDKNVIHLLKYVFKTFKKFNDIKKYNIYFIIYDPEEKLHNKIYDIVNEISNDFNLFHKYFLPSNKFKNLIEQYEKSLKKKSGIFCNFSNWSRFFINQLYPEIKTGLYLDLDILFAGDISPIFEVDLLDDIIAVSPYPSDFEKLGKKGNLICDSLHKERLLKSKLLEKFNMTLDDLKYNNYNCGVIYFNFEKYLQEDILNKIIITLEYMCDKGRFYKPSGTERIQTFLIPKYKSLSVNYNFIDKYFKINLNENKIIHFKGRGLSNKNSDFFPTFIENYNKIITKRRK